MDESNKENTGNNNNEKKGAWWMPAMQIFFRATAWIAFPVIAAVYIGDLLETKYGTKSHLMIIVVAAAFIVTMIGLIKMTLDEFKKMDKKK